MIFAVFQKPDGNFHFQDSQAENLDELQYHRRYFEKTVPEKMRGWTFIGLHTVPLRIVRG